MDEAFSLVNSWLKEHDLFKTSKTLEHEYGSMPPSVGLSLTQIFEHYLSLQDMIKKSLIQSEQESDNETDEQSKTLQTRNIPLNDQCLECRKLKDSNTFSKQSDTSTSKFEKTPIHNKLKTKLQTLVCSSNDVINSCTMHNVSSDHANTQKLDSLQKIKENIKINSKCKIGSHIFSSNVKEDVKQIVDSSEFKNSSIKKKIFDIDAFDKAINAMQSPTKTSKKRIYHKNAPDSSSHLNINKKIVDCALKKDSDIDMIESDHCDMITDNNTRLPNKSIVHDLGENNDTSGDNDFESDVCYDEIPTFVELSFLKENSSFAKVEDQDKDKLINGKFAANNKSRWSTYKRYEKEDLKTALDLIRNQNFSISKAAKMYGIPKSTLHLHTKKVEVSTTSSPTKIHVLSKEPYKKDVEKPT